MKPRPITFYKLGFKIKLKAPMIFVCQGREINFTNTDFHLLKNETQEWKKIYMQMCFIRHSKRYDEFVDRYRDYLEELILSSTKELRKLCKRS